MRVYDESIIESIVDIYRTSPINPHYPHGMNCDICRKAGIECYTDSGDGYECNAGYVKYLGQKLAKRKQLAMQTIPLDRVKRAREKIDELDGEYLAPCDGTNKLGPSKKYVYIDDVLEILDKLIESEEK